MRCPGLAPFAPIPTGTSHLEKEGRKTMAENPLAGFTPQQIEALRAALGVGAQDAAPVAPEIPKATLPDVLRALVHQARFGTEGQVKLYLEAIDDAFPEESEPESEPEVKSDDA